MISLQARVGWVAALVLGIFVVTTALTLDRAFQDSARSAMRERLFAQLYLVMAAADVDENGVLSVAEKAGDPRLELAQSGLYGRIVNTRQELLWVSPSAVGIQLPTIESRPNLSESFSRTKFQDQEYFVANLEIEWETGDKSYPLLFSVAEDLTGYYQQVGSYQKSLWAGLSAMAVFLMIAQGLALVWGLRPLKRVAKELNRIETGRQDRLEQQYPKELRLLTENVNNLLIHEHAQQSRYKDALADLAHSLKTPLAVLRGLEADSNLAHETKATLEQQVDRMNGIVQYQLQRAATSGRSVLAKPTLVVPVVERILSSLLKVYCDKNVSVEQSLPQELAFKGDEGDLMELLGNLLDNAFKWCSRKISITANGDARIIKLIISDDGPGISKEQSRQILKRGIRMDEATPGHGIGLAMVRDIVDAYKGQLQFSSSKMGGAEIMVLLPGYSKVTKIM